MSCLSISELSSRQRAQMHIGPKWTPLSAPIDPEETRIRMLAQSILSGPELGVCPTLEIEQARDVLAWHKPQH